MPTARNGDVELHYETHGEGEPLLLIQGLGYGVWGWFRQVPDLSRDFRVVVFDNRGVGSSTKVTDPYTVDDMADDAVAVLDAAGVDATSVLGVSLGGLIAQSLAIRRPERVRKLVLLATHHGGPDAIPVPEQTVRILTDPGEGLTPEERIRRNMPPAFRPGWVEEHPDTFDEIVGRRLEAGIPPWEAYVAQVQAAMSGALAGRLGEIRVPTLVLAGEGDRVVPSGNAKLLADGIPDTGLELHPRGGHLVMMEDPDWLNGRVRGFCS